MQCISRADEWRCKRRHCTYGIDGANARMMIAAKGMPASQLFELPFIVDVLIAAFQGHQKTISP